MQREEIKTFLPHREPMLLVDDVEMVGDQAIAHYHVKGDEFFLQGHFPGYPVALASFSRRDTAASRS